VRIVQYQASEFLTSEFIDRMTKDVSTLFGSYVYSHINFLEKADPDSAKANRNFILTVEDDAGKIYGFRYFYCENEMQRFHFFAVVMDREVSKKGYAIKTFNKAVKIANEQGYFNFIITINSETSNERDGLVNSYRRICTALNQVGNRFRVNYYNGPKFIGFELN
jgi:hypothetical protein